VLLFDHAEEGLALPDGGRSELLIVHQLLLLDAAPQGGRCAMLVLLWWTWSWW